MKLIENTDSLVLLIRFSAKEKEITVERQSRIRRSRAERFDEDQCQIVPPRCWKIYGQSRANYH